MNVVSKTEKLVKACSDNIGEHTDITKTPKRLQSVPESDEDFHFQPIDTTDNSIEMLTQKENCKVRAKEGGLRGLEVLTSQKKIFELRPSIDFMKQFGLSNNSNNNTKFNVNIQPKDNVLGILGQHSWGQALNLGYDLSNIKNEPATIEQKVKETQNIHQSFANNFIAAKFGTAPVGDGDEGYDDGYDDGDDDEVTRLTKPSRNFYSERGTLYESPRLIGEGQSQERMDNIKQEIESLHGVPLTDTKYTPVYHIEDGHKPLRVGFTKRLGDSPTIGITPTSAFEPIHSHSQKAPSPESKAPEPASEQEASEVYEPKDIQHLTVKQQKSKEEELTKIYKDVKDVKEKPLDYYNRVTELLTIDKDMETVKNNYKDDYDLVMESIRSDKTDKQKIDSMRSFVNLYRKKVGIEAVGNSLNLDLASGKVLYIDNTLKTVFDIAKKTTFKKTGVVKKSPPKASSAIRFSPTQSKTPPPNASSAVRKSPAPSKTPPPNASSAVRTSPAPSKTPPPNASSAVRKSPAPSKTPPPNASSAVRKSPAPSKTPPPNASSAVRTSPAKTPPNATVTSPTVEDMQKLVDQFPNDVNYQYGLQSVLNKQRVKMLVKK